MSTTEATEMPKSIQLDTTMSRAASAVSWSAILAGAAATAAMSLILLILGSGLELSAISPWAQEGISATTFTVTTILWACFSSLVAAGVGGYLAGRLRTRWLAVDPDEVYFRDTAHGFLTWAVATLATATLLTTVVAGILSAGVKTTVAIAESVVETGVEQYFLDSLFRRSDNTGLLSGDSVETPPATIAETGRIVAYALTVDSMPGDDLRYAAQLIAGQTGLSEQEAAQRVTDLVARIRSQLLEAETAATIAAEQARETAAYAALWLVVTLLGGAFVASLSATFGGRQRDQF